MPLIVGPSVTGGDTPQASELEPVASEDALLSMQRLMIAPALNDGLGE